MAEAPTHDTPMMASDAKAPPDVNGPAAQPTAESPRAVRERLYKRMLNASQPTIDPTQGYTLFGTTKAEARANFDEMVRDRLDDPMKLQAFSDPAEFRRAAERFMTAGDDLKAAKARLDAVKADLRAKLREYAENQEDIDESFDREYRPVWEGLFMQIKETKKDVAHLDKEEHDALKAVAHIINGEVASYMSRAQVIGPF
ncbi:hypothetical protein NW752_010199 [Fusarium irregulare]|uniref:Uncharacterized protein n=1 Tax=Fusarium irregulare TaxID=2494466 RepID=A0A9W8PIL7_9HYPO|nr:hypothetical protein NW752_010199 [Fusarium irregulare]KAJ4007841.1 hypothetical protein NW766_009649 [Fusarium irregulare]